MTENEFKQNLIIALAGNSSIMCKGITPDYATAILVRITECILYKVTCELGVNFDYNSPVDIMEQIHDVLKHSTSDNVEETNFAIPNIGSSLDITDNLTEERRET